MMEQEEVDSNLTMEQQTEEAALGAPGCAGWGAWGKGGVFFHLWGGSAMFSPPSGGQERGLTAPFSRQNAESQENLRRRLVLGDGRR